MHETDLNLSHEMLPNAFYCLINVHYCDDKA